MKRRTLEEKTAPAYDHIAASCALFATRRLARSLSRLYDVALGPSGLRGTQYNILVAIARRRGNSMTALSDLLGMDRTNLTHALRAMERDRLVESVAGNDARTRELRLTALGERRVAAAIPLWEQAQSVIETGLGDAGWRELNSRLRKLNHIVTDATNQVNDEDL